jgi:KDO2-lipid IV(A) lauroyltransferase
MKKDIQKAFPDKSAAEVKEIATESFINIGRMSAEFVKSVSRSRTRLFKRIELHNFEEIIKRNNEDGLGAILHIGHFVNWELIGLAAGYMLKKIAFVARPQSNPYVDAEITKMRTFSGAVKISSYNSPFFACFKYLKKGYMIAILSDQSVPASPLYMNFLGRPAEVGARSAVLALKMQIPVFPVFPYRKNGKIIIEAQPAIIPSEHYSQKAVYDLTKQLNDKYEEWIRKEPQSWLWAHNRWKREKHSLKKMQQQTVSAANAEAEK